ncbi:hypothetical protein BJX66DRAFT_333654 [Aspergillus keveii]|uniref:Uncharacterized protein n=1 Tax=Aspergillus keveii TaxID=714993 RepID=A0ABR4GIU1_9EURO
MSSQRTTTTNTTPSGSSAGSSTQIIQVIDYDLVTNSIQIYDRTATVFPGRVTRVTEITIALPARTITVSHRMANLCGSGHTVGRLAQADRIHQYRVIEMVREAVRDRGDFWYVVLPGMVETLGGEALDSETAYSGQTHMRAAYGHPVKRSS